MGVFKRLFITGCERRLRASLDASRFLLLAMQALSVSLAALCVKGKPTNMHQNRKNTRVCTSYMHILNVPWWWNHREVKHSETDKFYRVSSFITPFYQKGIYE